MLYDSIVGGIIRTLTLIIDFSHNQTEFLDDQLKFCIARIRRNCNFQTVCSELFTCLEMLFVSIMLMLFFVVLLILDNIFMPFIILFYAIIIPIYVYFSSESMEESLELISFFYFIAQLHQDGRIKRIYENDHTTEDAVSSDDHRALPPFSTEESESILRPLKAYWKPVGNDDLTRLQQNMIHETRTMLELQTKNIVELQEGSKALKLEVNVNYKSMMEEKFRNFDEKFQNMNENFKSMEEKHELILSLLKDVLNNQRQPISKQLLINENNA